MSYIKEEGQTGDLFPPCESKIWFGFTSVDLYFVFLNGFLTYSKAKPAELNILSRCCPISNALLCEHLQSTQSSLNLHAKFSSTFHYFVTLYMNADVRSIFNGRFTPTRGAVRSNHNVLRDAVIPGTFGIIHSPFCSCQGRATSFVLARNSERMLTSKRRIAREENQKFKKTTVFSSTDLKVAPILIKRQKEMANGEFFSGKR